MEEMRRLVIRETALPLVRMTAARIAADTPSRAPLETAARIRQWVAARWRFVRDPLDKELLHTPEAMLNMLREHGYITADCDDAAILCAALGSAVGLQSRFVAVAFIDSAAPYAHVWTELAAPTGTGPWVECDVTRTMQALPTHLISRFLILPVVAHTMNGTRGSADSARMLPSRIAAHVSPFSGVGSMGDDETPNLGLGLSLESLGEVMLGLGATKEEKKLAALKRFQKTVMRKPGLPGTMPGMMKRAQTVGISKAITKLEKKIAAKQAFTPAAAPAFIPTPTAPQPILTALAPPSPTDIAPSSSGSPVMPSYAGGGAAPAGFFPSAASMVDASGQPSSEAGAGSGSSDGGWLRSPVTWIAAGVVAFIVLRGPGSRSLR